MLDSTKDENTPASPLGIHFLNSQHQEILLQETYLHQVKNDNQV